MGKSSPKPPATPDYTAAAVAQGAANLEAAKQSAYMSNPNIYTPLGSQQVTWNKQSTIDQTAYNKAMEQFRADAAAGRPLGAPPDVKDFTVTIEQPTITQKLTPEAQATLEAQQRVERQLAGLGEQAIGKVGGIFGTPFAPNLAPMQTSIDYARVGQGPDITGMGQAVNAPGAEGLAAAPNLMAMGQATGGPQAAQLSQANLAGVGGVQNAPQAGLFGFAGAGPSATQLQGLNLGGVGGVAGGMTGREYGTAGGGPAGVQFGGLDTSGLQGIQGSVGQFGQAQGGPAAPSQIAGANLGAAGQVAGAPTEGRYGYAAANVPQQQLQQTLDTSGLAQMPVGAGMTAQQAILSRALPAVQAQRAALENQLANQGLVRGGEAYNAAMMEQAQKENDLITQAALQGISVDAAMRQQGFSELQAQADLANQARQAQFGMGLSGQQLYNQAVAQNLQQGLSLQDAQNRAQQQAFGQQLAGGQFAREGQQMQFQMGQQAQQAQNAAIAQNANLALQSGQFANQAQAQQFAQRLAAGEFGREAQMASFQTGQAAQDAVNRAIAQNFQQGMAGAEADRAAQAQRFGQAVTAGQFGQQQALAQFGMGQQAAQAANQAAAQNFEQALAAQAAQNQAQQQQFEQALGAQGFNQQAILAQFGMGQQAAQAVNAALAQNQQAALQQQAAQAARQAQMFGQGMDVAGFYNQALAQRQAAAQQQYQMQLAAQNQAFNQAQAAAAFANQARQQGLSEQMALRAQPLNEITALLGGSQIQMPQFQGYQGTQVAAAPMFAATQAAGNFAQQSYGNQVAAYNAQMGLLGGLAGAGATAYGLRK